MRKKLLIALAVVAGLVLVLVVIVAMQPPHFRIARSITIAATPEAVYEQVNDYHNWSVWSPWEKLDPNMKRTYEGPASGKGAAYSWVGNDGVGEGKMTITETKPGEVIKIKLEFRKPMEDTCDAQFDFKRAGQNTAVTWSMEGDKGFIQKAFCMVMDMDKMVGGDFEKGLKDLKAVVESNARATAPTTAPASAPADGETK